MKWYNNLYVGEKAKRRKHKIIMKTITRKPQIGIYYITLPLNDANSLEIYPSYILLQKHYRKQKMLIIGISEGYDEALLLTQEIIMDCYNKTGQFLVRKMINAN